MKALIAVYILLADGLTLAFRSAGLVRVLSLHA